MMRIDRHHWSLRGAKVQVRIQRAALLIACTLFSPIAALGSDFSLPADSFAKHAEPPMSEKVRILAWLGADAGKFRGLDGQVHDAATAMGEAAQRNDGQAVIEAFSKTQQSCLACHQSFRHSFVEKFYGSR